MNRLRIASLACLPLFMFACTVHGDDDAATGGEQALTEAPTPRKGSTIHSPSVDPNKMYWGARTISTLVSVGYLTPTEATVAQRADGIIASSPPNGKIGVDELAILESPAHINTLFPAEKAVIPKLWKILLIDDATSYTPSLVSITPTAKTDTYPVTPFQMAISALPASFQQLASRVELTQDEDGNASTLSANDLEKAYGDKSSYLPAEITELRQIHQAVAAAAPQLAADAQSWEFPGASQHVLFSNPSAQLVDNETVSLSGTYNGNPAFVPRLNATSSLVMQSMDRATSLVLLDKGTGTDALYQGQANAAIGNTQRIEVWTGGVRTAEIDASPGGGASADVPFGYAIKIGAVKYVLGCTQQGCSYYQNGGGYAPMMPPTSYYVSGHPDYRLDVFANGRALLVGAGQTLTCYPQTPGWNQRNVPGCVIFTPTGGQASVVTYGSAVGDQPALATGNFQTFGQNLGLYVY